MTGTRRRSILQLLSVLAATLVIAGLWPASSLGQGLSAEQVKKLKAATVFVKVQAGIATVTGSGFIVRAEDKTAYVITNLHVVDIPIAPAPGQTPQTVKRSVDVVLHSGTADERIATADIAAYDPTRDLAVLRISGIADLPAPIDPNDSPKLLETMPVFVCGFPFGQRLGTQKNPEISIGPASVSSIRTGPGGQVAMVQLNGALNPGNSGGPVVTAEGQLVGVAVATIKGAGIGFAIPQHEVASMLKGRAGPIRLVPAGTDYALDVLIIDPLQIVKSAAVLVRPVDGDLPPRPGPDGPTAMPDAKRVPLPIQAATSSGRAPVKLADDGKRALWVQVELTTSAGKVLSAPAEVKLGDVQRPATTNRADSPFTSGPMLPAPTDRLPAKGADTDLVDLNRNPEGFAGKAVEFDALTSCGLKARDDGYELELMAESLKPPSSLRVVVPKDIGLQLSDLGVTPEDTFAIRVKGDVRKPVRGDVRHTVEVRQVQFVDSDGKATATMKPETAPPAGPPTLAAVNRFPDKFQGKPLVLEAIYTGIGFAGSGFEVKIVNDNNVKPLNLDLFTSKTVGSRAEDEIPRGPQLARLSCTIERVSAKTGHGIVGVNKIEILDSRTGKVAKTLAADDKIIYPYEPPPRPPAAPKPAAAAAEDEADEPVAAKGTPWRLIAMIVGGLAVLLIGGCVVGLVVMSLRRGKGDAEVEDTRTGRRADASRGEPEPAPRPVARPNPRARQKPPAGPGNPPDAFPGFGE
ncbi:S1 family peptidase [Fimbriiglobus ruber]|uniref:Serine protease n=1 Tax=Fimbriiglobus ruber TaxID=1908690 RepID=A0A225DRC8_9BACT|nr:serine protease [Fimbriiglobus ruber]OWK43952.1 Serine protease [Fimbriiglobus ruber]